jgi:hypothetical protein
VPGLVVTDNWFFMVFRGSKPTGKNAQVEPRQGRQTVVSVAVKLNRPANASKALLTNAPVP